MNERELADRFEQELEGAAAPPAASADYAERLALARALSALDASGESRGIEHLKERLQRQSPLGHGRAALRSLSPLVGPGVVLALLAALVWVGLALLQRPLQPAALGGQGLEPSASPQPVDATVPADLPPLSDPLRVANKDGDVLELRSVFREQREDGSQVRAVFCFLLPTSADWQIGGWSEDVVLQVGGESYLYQGGGVLPGEGGGNEAGRVRCAYGLFPVPQEIALDPMVITVQELVTSMPDVPDCQAVQARLDQAGTGITVRCEVGDHTFGYEIERKPEGMTDAEARDMAYRQGFVQILAGPWVFETGPFVSNGSRLTPERAAMVTPALSAPTIPAPAQDDSGLPRHFAALNSDFESGLWYPYFQGVPVDLKPGEEQMVKLYRQLPESAPLTQERAQAVADLLGFAGEMKASTGEGGKQNFLGEDGKGSLMVWSDDPLWFVYQPDKEAFHQSDGSLLPIQTREQTAAEFLIALDLHPAGARRAPLYSPADGTEQNGIAFYQAVGNRSVTTLSPDTLPIQVLLDQSGKIIYVKYQDYRVEEAGTVMVRPFAAVWQDVVSGRMEGRSALWVAGKTDPANWTEPALVFTTLEYLAADFQTYGEGIPAEDLARLLAPVWHYFGKFANGQEFEIFAEAFDRPGGEIFQATPTPLPAPAGSVVAVPNAAAAGEHESVNARQGPSVLKEIIFTVPAGQVVPVLGKSPQCEWLLVELAGQQGWVYAPLMSVQGDLGPVPVVEVGE